MCVDRKAKKDMLMCTLRGSFRMMAALGVAAAGAEGVEAAENGSPTITAGHRVQPYLSTGDDNEAGKVWHER